MAKILITLIVGIALGMVISNASGKPIALSLQATNLIGLFAIFLILMGVWCAPRAFDARHRRADDWKDKKH